MVRKGFAALALLLFPTLVPAAAHARGPSPNHGGAAAGGAVAGLVCGGITLTYSKLRVDPEKGPSPLLWHGGDSGPGWIGVFFAEHAVAGGLTGAFGDGPREGFVIGGLVTCGLDLIYVVTSEILAATDEPVLAAVQFEPGRAAASHKRVRFGVPPVAVNRRGAWVSLFAVRF